jgi:hypothetical protein
MYGNGVVRRGNHGTGSKHCLSLSCGVALTASVAAYVLAYFLFTIHEEIGISSDAALPIAVWTFPIMFLGTLIGCLARKVGLGRR